MRFKRLLLKILVIFTLIQAPFLQKHALLLGNIFLAPLGYTYTFDQVHGIFPFFLSIHHLRVFQGKQPLMDAHYFYVDSLRLSAEQIRLYNVQSDDSEESTDWGRLYSVLKVFNFWRVIEVSSFAYSGQRFKIYIQNRKDQKNLQLIAQGQPYFEVQAALKNNKGVITFQTIDQSYSVHARYDDKNFYANFQDFEFQSDLAFKKGRLSFKDHVVKASLFNHFLTFRYKDIWSKLNLKKGKGVLVMPQKPPLFFSFGGKNNQLFLYYDPKRFIKYDLNLGVGFIYFDENKALFRDFAFKNIHVELPQPYDLQLDGSSTLSLVPYFDIRARPYGYCMEARLKGQEFELLTAYLQGAGTWNFKEVYLKQLKIKNAMLKKPTLIYPYIDQLELQENDKVVFLLKNCDYQKFEKIWADWQLYFPVLHCHVKTDLKKDETLNGTLSVSKIITPYLDKVFSSNMNVKNNALQFQLWIDQQPLMKGHYHLTHETGVLHFNATHQDFAITGNDIAATVEGKVEILGQNDMKGKIHIQGGYFENVSWGLIINNLNGDINFQNEKVQFQIAADQFNVQGNADLKTQKSAYKIHFDHFPFIRTDLAQIWISGDIAGALWPVALEGKISLEKGIVTLSAPPLTQSFDLLRRIPKSPAFQIPMKGSLDIIVNDTLDINAFNIAKTTWGGNLKVNLDDSNVRLKGKFEAKHGTAELLGRTMFLKEGMVEFSEKHSLNPHINISFIRTVEDKELKASIQGDANTIDTVDFSSTPSMPKEDIVSYLLFSTPTQKLSEFQVIRLATALTTFTLAQVGGLHQLNQVASLVDLQKVQMPHKNVNERVLSIGKEWKNTKFALQRKLTSKAFNFIIEQKLSEHLSAILNFERADADENTGQDKLSIEAKLRYAYNYG